MKHENLTLIIHILMSSSAQLENVKLAHKVSLEVKRLNAYSNTNTKLALRARIQVHDFEDPENGFRNLQRTKFRLTKGDDMLKYVFINS